MVQFHCIVLGVYFLYFNLMPLYVEKDSVFCFSFISFQTKATTVEQLENLDKVKQQSSCTFPIC